MLTITIGSKNFAKVEAVKRVFTEEEVISLSVPSLVSEQPFSDDETIKGALNRAENALQAGSTYIGIGLEGGVVEMLDGLFLCNWGALVDRNGFSTIAGGARLRLPDEVAEQVRQGKELGPVMDDYARKRDVRQLEGAVGILTNGKINRLEMFQHVVMLLAGQYEFTSKSKGKSAV